MRAVLGVLLVGAVLSVALAGGALGYGTVDATYSADGATAHVTVMGQAGARVRVFGEQCDGSYSVVAVGAIGSAGPLTFVLPVSGPSNGMPQFRVVINDSDGTMCVCVADKEYAFD
jgi:hypothetical protein